MVITNKQRFNILFNNPKNASNTLEYISKKMKISMSDINEVMERGTGAFYNNPSSVRPHVKSAEQWAYSRLYKFIQDVIKIRKNPNFKASSDNDLVRKYIN